VGSEGMCVSGQKIEEGQVTGSLAEVGMEEMNA
jgi:hypothetical protein